jgi:hypothetical protein
VVVPWVTLVALALLFILVFFGWTGAYPSGYGVYTQSGFQAIFGSYSVDPVGEKVLNKDQEIRENIHANWFLMGLYFLLVLASLVLAAAPKIIDAASLRLPPAIQPYWPWRLALLAVVVDLAFLLLLIQLVVDFGLEKALTSPVAASNSATPTSILGDVEKMAASLKKERAEATTAEEKKKVEIKEGVAVGRFNLHRTGALWLVVVLNLVGIAGALTEHWLKQRGPRPMPRIEIQW